MAKRGQLIAGDDAAYWLGVKLLPLGSHPITKLRRHSADVTACFLLGFSIHRIVLELGVGDALVEDAIRWEMKRRDRRRRG